MEHIKYFIECLIPVTACNIKCHYCYIVQRNQRKMGQAHLTYTPETIRKGLSLSRLGGIAYISICGAGETLLQKEMPEIVKYLLEEGHYINITTNGTVSYAFERIISITSPNYLKRLHFAFSYHYLELKRRNLFNSFWENVDRIRNAGCSFLIQLNLCDEYVPYIADIKRDCLEHVGAYPQVAATRDEKHLGSDVRLFTSHSQIKYEDIGNSFDSPLFRFTMKNFMVKRKEFCYAGKSSFVLNLSTGILKPCYASNLSQNIFENTEKPIRFTAIGKHCKSLFCMNSSHFMAWGVIPSVPTPSYADLRNRQCNDGREWYTPTMKSALNQKLEGVNMNVSRMEVEWQNVQETLLTLYLHMKNQIRKIMPEIIVEHIRKNRV